MKFSEFERERKKREWGFTDEQIDAQEIEFQKQWDEMMRRQREIDKINDKHSYNYNRWCVEFPMVAKLVFAFMIFALFCNGGWIAWVLGVPYLIYGYIQYCKYDIK